MSTNYLIDLLIALLTGAGIGAIALYMVLKNRLKTSDQSVELRRIGLLEQVSQHVGRVNYVFSKYASLVNDIGPHSDRMSVNQKRELETLSNELVAVYEEVSVAESKLLLLGEQRLEKALKIYTAKMAQFRKQIYPGRYTNPEDAAKMRREVGEMRDQFYTILSERYDQKLG